MHIPALQPGDKVAILSTARSVSFQEIEKSIVELKKNGYIPVIGSTIDKTYSVFAGEDAFRADDLQKHLNDPEIKAILFARGGYGTIRILEKIDFTGFVNSPKWLCGFSDITVLHTHINDKLAIPTVHSAMPFNFPTAESDTINSLFSILRGNIPDYQWETAVENKPGSAEGELIGGNLSILFSLLGTKYGFNTAGKILFIEDVDEYLYHIDRMMMSMLLAGKLQHLKGIIVGGFTEMKDNKVPFGKSVEQIIMDHVQTLQIPVAFHFPAGHTPLNKAMIFGKKIRLQCTSHHSHLKYI